MAASDQTAHLPRTYWAEIAIRGYESLPKVEQVGHHEYPTVIPAILNLAALDDHSGGRPWEIDVLAHKAGGKMLDTHKPEEGCWERDDSAWSISPSKRDDDIHLPEFSAALECMSKEGEYAIECRQTELGELALIRIAGMRVGVLPGSDNRPTCVIVPKEQVRLFRQALEGTLLMKRFRGKPGASPRALIPNRTAHDWLGVTSSVTEISTLTRMSLPGGDQPFFLDTLKRLENFQGDLQCLAPEDLRRFNALRHQYLMPEAMFGPVPAVDVNDESYELSSLICMAGTMHSNLDAEARALNQPISLESLERKVRLHIGQAVREDQRRHERWWGMYAPAATEIMKARVAANQEQRASLASIIQEEPMHLPPKVTPIESIRHSQGLVQEEATCEFGEYPTRSDFHYRSQMTPL